MNKQTLQAIIKVHQCEGCREAEATGEARHLEYLGSALSLDPCGRYHHMLSPNGLTEECEAYWTELEQAANDANAWTESGEGDGLDVFLAWPLEG